MEKNKCNERGVGGQMRSHMPPKPEEEQLGGDEYESTQSFSSSSEEENGDKELFGYGLRENPKKSFRLVDPEFAGAGSSSVVLQDRESETESFKNRPVLRRRSKRIATTCSDFREMKKTKLSNERISEFDGEQMSSISDTSLEEEAAYSLTMLSRDSWERKLNRVAKNNYFYYNYEEDLDEDEDEDEEEVVIKVNKCKSNKTKGKYRCETCNRMFKSYQALGGHRASHKKFKELEKKVYGGTSRDAGGTTAVVEEKVHECPFCFRVFASGQALGGHKRSHGLGSSALVTSNVVNGNLGKQVATHGGVDQATMIDLNLPAPADDDDEFSQVELSAVSDAQDIKF